MPVAAPGSAAPKMAERAGGGTSLRGLRERMGERASGSRGCPGPCGTRASRGFGDRRSGRTLLRSRLARRRVLPSPPSERPGTGRVAERGRGREGRPAQALQPNCHCRRPHPLRRAGRERTNGRYWGGRAGAWHPGARGQPRAPPAFRGRRAPGRPSRLRAALEIPLSPRRSSFLRLPWSEPRALRRLDLPHPPG